MPHQFYDKHRTFPAPTMELTSRADCGSDPNWQATATAYNDANSDNLVAQWWAGQAKGSFANTLAKSFGDEPTNFECGIEEQSSCSIAGCQRMSTPFSRDKPLTI
jgi:hypothetical protein